MDTLENKYQYNGKELEDALGLNWNDYGARYYLPDIQRWGQIDPLAEKYAAWSGYNYVEDNPMRKVDPDGKGPMDNYYMNEAGDMLGVVRTGDSQDNFYVVDPNNQVTLVHTHELDPTWSRVTDGEKNAIVNRIRKLDHYGEVYQANGEGLDRDQQNRAAGALTNAGSVASQAGVATGTANINGATVLGAIYSTINPTPPDREISFITQANPVNPGGAPANRVVPQGTLPTPTDGRSLPLPAGNLTPNLSKPFFDDAQQTHTIQLTDQQGLIPQP